MLSLKKSKVLLVSKSLWVWDSTNDTTLTSRFIKVDEELKIVCPIPNCLATFGTSKTEKYQIHRAHHDQVERFKEANPLNPGHDRLDWPCLECPSSMADYESWLSHKVYGSPEIIGKRHPSLLNHCEPWLRIWFIHGSLSNVDIPDVNINHTITNTVSNTGDVLIWKPLVYRYAKHVAKRDLGLYDSHRLFLVVTAAMSWPYWDWSSPNKSSDTWKL